MIMLALVVALAFSVNVDGRSRRHKKNKSHVTTTVVTRSNNWYEVDGNSRRNKKNRSHVTTTMMTTRPSNTVATQWNGVGLPRMTRAASEKILHREGYVTSYNSTTLCPNWTAWRLTAENTQGPFKRKGQSYTEDTEVSPRATYDDWRSAKSRNYDHGHMCPAGDNKWSPLAMQHTFLLTNMCPQDHDLNTGSWERLESACRNWVQRTGSLYIVCGPIFRSSRGARMGRVSVPDAFYKVILRTDGTPRAIGFVYENTPTMGRDNMQNHVVPISRIESMTGITFFPQLPRDVASRVKNVTNFNDWNRF